MSDTDSDYLHQAIELAKHGMVNHSGGPFGAIVVKNNQVVGKGFNQVTVNHDPTAHAEIMAIRDACIRLDSFQLEGCTIYSSCEPCPMCLGAIYWARPDRLVFACTREDAAKLGFDDDFIYDEIGKHHSERKIETINLLREEGYAAMRLWLDHPDRIEY